MTYAEFISQACGEFGISSAYAERPKPTQTIRRIKVNYVPSILLQFEQIDNMLIRKNKKCPESGHLLFIIAPPSA